MNQGQKYNDLIFEALTTNPALGDIYTIEGVSSVINIIKEFLEAADSSFTIEDLSKKVKKQDNKSLTFPLQILLASLYIGSEKIEVGNEFTHNQSTTAMGCDNRQFKFGMPHLEGHEGQNNGFQYPHTHLGMYSKEEREFVGLHIRIKNDKKK